MATIKKIKKAQAGERQGRNPKNADYERTAPLQKGTNRDRNLTNTLRQDVYKMKSLNKEKNDFVGPLTKFGNITSEDDKYVKYRGPKYDETPKGRVDRQQKTGGKVSKAKDGKWIQKATASIKKRGTAGKCTPITKPGCTGRAKALAKTFKKMAKKK
jgi:hypothetical protein